MSLDRRIFLTLSAGGLLAGTALSSLAAQSTSNPQFKAIAFDGFPIFDPRPVGALAETLFPGKGSELSTAWRTRQFEYQWLRALSGQYADFMSTTEDALVFAARMLHLELAPEKRSQLLEAYRRLTVWPDVPTALATLKNAGIRLAFLSNMTRSMLDDGIAAAGLHGLFEHVLSTDQIRTYKPDPRAYQLATDALALPREQILFAAFAGWDVAGAKWFGYPTFWVNRLDVPAEELAPAADATGRDLHALVSFVTSRR